MYLTADPAVNEERRQRLIAEGKIKDDGKPHNVLDKNVHDLINE